MAMEGRLRLMVHCDIEEYLLCVYLYTLILTYVMKDVSRYTDTDVETKRTAIYYAPVTCNAQRQS